jgi:hypothetical protein
MMSGRTAPAAAMASRLVPVLFAALLLVLVVSTLGCSQEEQSLVGTWTSIDEGETLDFRADGTLYLTRASGAVDTLRWQAEGGSLAMSVSGEGTRTFDYSIDEQVLTLSYPDEQPARYVRLELQGD